MPPIKKRTTKKSGARKAGAKKATTSAKRATAGRSSANTTTTRSSRKRATAGRSGTGSGRFTMTQAHKDALAKGREASRHVRAYLEALEQHRPRRGRQRTAEMIRKQLDEVDTALAEAGPMQRLELIAKRMQLADELRAKQIKVDLAALRRNFIKYAPHYARSKGIPAQAFRQAGVPASDLRAAGLK